MKHVGRKMYHMAGGLGLLSLYFILGKDRALWTYAALFAVVLAIDLIRLNVPAFNRFMFSRFGSFIRKNEEHRLTGTAPYVLGVGLSFLLFPADIAAAAICFLAVGDVSATTIGERYGKTKIGSKSLEGTFAFAVAAVTVGFLLPLVGIPIGHVVVLIGALVAAGVELIPVTVNDNLVIPLVSGGVMTLIVHASGHL